MRHLTLCIPSLTEVSSHYILSDDSMTVELRSPQRTLKPVINPMSGRTLINECIIFSWEQELLYNLRWPILYNTIPPLLLLCCFYLLKALPYMVPLGFFGEYSGSLLSGLLLTTPWGRPKNWLKGVNKQMELHTYKNIERTYTTTRMPLVNPQLRNEYPQPFT